MNEEKSINASPTKEFFVSMLVKDIMTKQAIIELIDNSIDGARALYPKHEYVGVGVEVSFSKDKFEIFDNCGGIPVSVAADVAFRFGRPSEADPKNGETTGIFGIGMKRALFKLGKKIKIESKTRDSEFAVTIDVLNWLTRPEWDFSFDYVKEDQNNQLSETGTKIVVEDLYPEISGEIGDSDFEDELCTHVERRIGLDISNGISIKINGRSLKGNNIKVISTEKFIPIKETYTDSTGVNVDIIAGLSPKEGGKYIPENAGWYIYCNGRLIVAADKSSLTTWRDMENKNNDVAFHNTYAPFRGIVMFSSNNPALLPWNTTKTGIDVTSLVFLRAREKMLEIFKIVRSFFDEIAAYAKENEDDGVESSIANMNSTEVTSSSVKSSMNSNRSMSIKAIEINPNPNVRISYQKPKSEVETLKRSLGVKNNSEVGQKTFEYYMDAEC